MAIMSIVRYTGDPDELEFGLGRILALTDRRRPDGFRFHSSAVTEDGLVLVDLWTSEEALTAWNLDPEFRSELERLKIPRPSQVEICPVVATWPGELTG